jgi:hypothetical protein
LVPIQTKKDEFRAEKNDASDSRWIQLNVGLVRQQKEALPNARHLFARLDPLIQQWRKTGQLRWVFFMRKPQYLTLEDEAIIWKGF